MKKFSFLAVIICLIGLSSCQRGVTKFEGDYSFKTSGKAVFNEKNTSDTTTFNLNTESGQMNIKISEAGTDSVVLVMNVMNGVVYVALGFIDDDRIELKPFSRPLANIVSTSSLPNLISVNYNFDVEVSGEGRMYDDVIIFNLNYRGTGTYDEKEGDVCATNVTMVANKNG